MAAIDELVRQWMEKVERSGEMHAQAGKPLTFDDGYDQTPQELRMAHKILKNAGYVPAEVEHLQALADMRSALASAADDTARRALQQAIAELETRVRVRLEHLRGGH